MLFVQKRWDGTRNKKLTQSIAEWQGRLERQSKMLESEGAGQKATRDPGNGFSRRTTLERALAATDHSLGGEEDLSGQSGYEHYIFAMSFATEFY